ncbi:ATP-binding protein [Desulfoscipio gibsoniae]|uniref:histidine kinase n=1 Tax=Desulfoscipio gibsoniae DSM 7213 TaxID=767817 RepID=R4KGN8_9FIRM|nr:DUF3365 domain-containing protein [Desulfoscipio gibsoniae]AGL02368.1 signal transduction histidine kinase [Desulfoscipio gibsoniae DSM 7213]
MNRDLLGFQRLFALLKVRLKTLAGLLRAGKAAGQSFINGLSLSTRLLWGMSIVIVAFTTLSVAWDIYDIRREAETEMLHRSRVVAQELISLRAVIALNQEKINTDPVTGNVMFKHLNPASVGRQVAEIFNETTSFSLKQTRLGARNPVNQPDFIETKMLNQLADDPGISEVWQEESLEGRWYFRYMLPLRAEESCLICHGEPAGEMDIAGYPMEGLKLGDLAGAISLRIPMDSFQEALRMRIWGRIIIAIFFVIITRWISAHLAKRMVAGPLGNLTAMARRLGEGDWEAVRSVAGTGEIRVLSQVFEQVARQLKESHNILEEKVRKRTMELSNANKELERANRFKSDVLANVSHELRTPLTAVIAFTEMLQDPATGKLNKKQREYLEDIADSSRQLLMEVTDLLQMARLEAGKLEISPEPLDLVEVIGESLSMLDPLARKKNIKIVFPSETGEWWVLADRAKVRHILNNLVNNSIKFTQKGGKVVISVERSCGRHCLPPDLLQEESGVPSGEQLDCLLVGVADNGIGIAPGDKQNIFEKFHQLGQPGQGAGLGLALVKELVLLHGGKIWVESVPGCGSTFYFTLPLKEQML